MTAPLATISGIASGIQYRDLVDQIIAAERAPAIRAEARISQHQQRISALSTLRGLMTTFKASAQALREGTAFDGMSTTTSILTGTKQLGTGTAKPGAQPASYRLEVSTLAAAQKLGATGVPDSTTALGTAGTITLNGTDIVFGAGDSLADLRDKINAANTGATPTRISAAILTVGASSHRLVLQSETSGAAGMTLADTSGTVLQSLGVLSNPTTINSSAVLVAGSDANFKLDGISFTRTTNTITDAIPDVTLTLTNAEAGAVTDLTVERFLDGARKSAKDFVAAYNAVIDFLKTQGTATPKADGTPGTRPALYGDSALRTARSALPTTLLTTIGGTAADLSTASLAGFSLDRDGKLSLNETTFDTAFSSRLSDLRQLFQQRGTTSGAGLSYVTSTTGTQAGTYAVDITALATKGQVLGTGLAGGPYADDGTADTMTVSDAQTGKSVDVLLSAGMTATDIATALNAAFTANGMSLTASDVGGEVQLDHTKYGSAANFMVGYTAGGTLSSTLPIAAGTYAGTDVAGTIGGLAATGTGQSLFGGSGLATSGLIVQYNGGTTGPAGDVTVTLGTGALIERQLKSWLDTNTGTVDVKTQALNDQIASLTARVDRIDARLELRKQALLAKFIRMESAIASFQSGSSGVLAVFNALTRSQG